MKTHLIAYFVAAFIIAPLQLNAQHISFNKRIPNENIDLITDRSTYLNGEKICFEAFYTTATNGVSSKVLYAEIFNADGNVIGNKKFWIEKGVIAGMLPIPEETPTGTYYLRAYTKYQRNFHPESYAMLPLQVFNPEIKATESISTDSNLIQLNASGGTLLDKIPSKVVFRLSPDWLSRIEELFLSMQDSILQKNIPFYKNGLGSIDFTPKAAETYVLQIKLKNGDTIQKAMPAAKTNGISFHLYASEEFLYLLVNRTVGTGPEELKATFLSKEHLPVYQKNIPLNNNSTEITIPAHSLPRGVNYLLIENKSGSVVYAHAFLNPVFDLVELDVSTNKKLFGKREKVELNISCGNDTLAKVLSAAVVKSGTFSKATQLSEPLISNPILLDRFGSAIASFDKKYQDQIGIALDLYDAYLSDNLPVIVNQDELCKDPGWPAETRGPSISGIVRDKETEHGLEENKVMASTLFKNQQLHINESRENGRFDISLAYPGGKQTVYLLAEPAEDKNPEVLIFNDFSTDFPRLVDAVFSPDTSQKFFFEELLVNKQIRDRFANYQVEEKTSKDLPYWYGKPTASYQLDDYIDFNTMTEVFHEIIPNVRLRAEGNKYYFRVYDDKLNVFYDDPLVLIDNTPVFDINKITRIFPAQVERVDIINRTYILGHRFIRGIISIRTKTNDLAGIEFPDEAVFYEYHTPVHGTTIREQKYNEENVAGKLPDFRTVLYWKPGIKTKHKTDIEFYTSDHASEYDVIVRGVTTDGRPCYGRSKFRVGKQTP